jgi:hypothetical protein
MSAAIQEPAPYETRFVKFEVSEPYKDGFGAIAIRIQGWDGDAVKAEYFRRLALGWIAMGYASTGGAYRHHSAQMAWPTSLGEVKHA